MLERRIDACDAVYMWDFGHHPKLKYTFHSLRCDIDCICMRTLYVPLHWNVCLLLIRWSDHPNSNFRRFPSNNRHWDPLFSLCYPFHLVPQMLKMLMATILDRNLIPEKDSTKFGLFLLSELVVTWRWVIVTQMSVSVVLSKKLFHINWI